jgi:lysine-ketoglutarate reductase/saccharopine dehydrogenase-like protein (TIGR00300 family)
MEHALSMPSGVSRSSQEVELRGHIIDSLILPKVLDSITAAGGEFTIRHIAIGQGRQDPSHAVIEVRADTQSQLESILAVIADHGAVPVAEQDCQLAAADIAGTFPEDFYSSTNQRTEVRIGGRWLRVEDQEMDCGIVVDAQKGTARCVAMSDVQFGETLVVGHHGVRVFPPARVEASHTFEFMNSAVSTEKPKGIIVRRIAEQLHRARQSGGRTLLVGGPAIVHTGSSEYLCQMIRQGYFNVLFAGNALAAHDIEQALFGTSLGVHLTRGDIVEFGHEHHLRAINRIRRLGGIRPAVEQGVLKRGIMYECVRSGVDYMLAGSIRDDGPLPDVVTDTLEAQRVMREKIRGVTLCLMVATTLHSIAVGNLLPAWVEVVCVDINPSTVIKLNDRGSFQTVGLVTDVAPFLRQLLSELETLSPATQ